MEITVWNRDREKLGLVEIFDSLVWVDRYDVAGEFELVLDMSTSAISNLLPERFLSIPYSNKWMVIERLEVNTDIEDGDKLKVSGRSLESLLSRRNIYYNFASYGGDLENVVAGLIWAAWSYPAIPERNVDFMYYELSTDARIQSLVREGRWENSDNIYDVVVGLCQEFGIGWTMEYNPYTTNIHFKLYLGENRSYTQNYNPYIIFSRENKNLLKSQYIYSSVPYKTAFHVSGPQEPFPQQWNRSYIPGTWEGLDIREVWIDASDISRYDPGTGLPWSVAEYQALLLDRAKQEYQYYLEYNQFTGEAITQVFGTVADGIYKLNEDYFLGDLVHFEDPYGLSGTAMIIEVTIAEDMSGLSIHPTFVFE